MRRIPLYCSYMQRRWRMGSGIRGSLGEKVPTCKADVFVDAITDTW